MKKYFLSLVAVMIATMSYAQIMFVSTLQHEGMFTHYYGTEAFSLAYNAAAAGDTITLSGGNFTFSGNFEKGVTVRGVGVNADQPTILTSEMKFYSNVKDLYTTFEGVRFNQRVNFYNQTSEKGHGKLNFIKCFFSGEVNATYGNPLPTENGPATRFTNCVLANRMYFDNYSNPYFMFFNCYVYSPYCSSTNNITTNLTTFENCVINYRRNRTGTSSGTYVPNSYYAYKLSFYNSIFVFDSTPNYSFPSTAIAQNCLSINYSLNYDTNKYSNNISEIFKTYVDGYDSEDNFALTEAAAATYLGTDGTQIGVNGGHNPFTQVVQYPVITTLKANQTTKEGILNVEVGVDEQ